MTSKEKEEIKSFIVYLGLLHLSSLDLITTEGQALIIDLKTEYPLFENIIKETKRINEILD